MAIRVATFNAENLFARYRFRDGIDPMRPDGFTVNEIAFADLTNAGKHRLTAAAIREVNADVMCLQEADSLNALDQFSSEFLRKMKYTHRILIDSHDPRHIDVAVLSRLPIAGIRTHRHERNKAGTDWKFSRDCLEVDVDVDGKVLTLFVNHLKSMIGGRAKTRKKREEQSERVVEFIEARYAKRKFKANFVVLGDLNDFIDPGTGIGALVQHPGVENVLTRRPPEEQWTHYYDDADEYRQLDYLLLSRGLAKKNPGLPVVMRKGLPRRAKRYDGPRFEGVGHNNPKSSDHAPLYMDIELL